MALLYPKDREGGIMYSIFIILSIFDRIVEKIQKSDEIKNEEVLLC